MRTKFQTCICWPARVDIKRPRTTHPSVGKYCSKKCTKHQKLHLILNVGFTCLLGNDVIRFKIFAVFLFKNLKTNRLLVTKKFVGMDWICTYLVIFAKGILAHTVRFKNKVWKHNLLIHYKMRKFKWWKVIRLKF